MRRDLIAEIVLVGNGEPSVVELADGRLDEELVAGGEILKRHAREGWQPSALGPRARSPRWSTGSVACECATRANAATLNR